MTRTIRTALAFAFALAAEPFRWWDETLTALADTIDPDA